MEGKKGWKQLELKKRSKKLKKHARKIEDATTRHAHRFLISRWDKIREVRLHIILWMASVGVLIAVVGIQMTWFQQSYITKAPVSGGTYAEAVKGSIQTLNPLYAETPAELSLRHLLFSSLYTLDTTGHLKGDLATAIKNESDKVFTVNLRHDARWHDGHQLTASDVVFTVELMKNPATHAVMAASWQNIGAERVDDYTVKFTLPTAYAAFPQEGLTFSILPMHLLKNVTPSTLRETGFSTAPIGSGPFTLRLLQVVSQTTGRKIAHLDANEDYYNGRPRLDYFQLHAYKDDDGIARALRTGEVNAASDVSSEVASNVSEDRYNIITRPVNDGVYAIFNTAQPTLKDVEVRRALQMVTDTSLISGKIYGHPKQLHLPFIPEQVESADSIPMPRVDPTGAARLLDRAGWTLKDGVRVNKDGAELRLRVVTRKNVNYEIALETVASQWRKLGVQIDTVIFDTSNPTQSFATDILQQRNYDVLLDRMVLGGDPDVFVYWHSRGQSNFANYSNTTSDDDLASARTTSDLKLRSVKYVAFAKRWLADAPAIGLYQPNFIYVHTKNTQAVQPDETIVSADEHYAGVRYWTAKQGTVYKTP